MLFNSWQFLLFFPVAVAVYFLMPQRVRNLWLLACSYFFYMCWRADYVALLLFSTLVDYFAARWMTDHAGPRGKRWLLCASLVTNLGLLFSFKYFNFFNESARQVFEHYGWAYGIADLDVLLPVGISFYTFQSLSYTLDVYRGEREPERGFVDFALYVSFFPQLVAGPIERSTRLLPQLQTAHGPDPDRMRAGLTLMLWGFFKKMVIADRLAQIVENVYAAPAHYHGPALLLATYAFAFQIYCDFSGYSDIAIGAARMMGVDLMVNFRRPYFAQSIGDFWQRWHISLSTWFRDYLYIPLGGNRVSRARWYANLLIVFVVSGLWHGANWTFVVWGALHGGYMVAGLLLKPLRERLGKGLLERWPRAVSLAKILFTFHLVVLGWIFFRANSVADGWYVVTHLWEGWGGAGAQVAAFGVEKLILAGAGVAVLLTVHALERDRPLVAWLDGRRPWVRWAFGFVLTLVVLNLGAVNEVPFIYFQF